MIAVDTNVLARFILADDPIQTSIAARMLSEAVWVASTVWVELGWVLGKQLAMDRAIVANAIETVLNLHTVHTSDPDRLLWALARYRMGADWADAMHLVISHNSADRFATFDRRLSAQAGHDAPMPIETLR